MLNCIFVENRAFQSFSSIYIYTVSSRDETRDLLIKSAKCGVLYIWPQESPNPPMGHVLPPLLVLASAFTRGRLSRHHQSRWPRLERKNSRPGGPVRPHLTLSPSPVSIVRGRWLAVRKSVSGRPWSFSPCLQLSSSSSAPRARRCG